MLLVSWSCQVLRFQLQSILDFAYFDTSVELVLQLDTSDADPGIITDMMMSYCKVSLQSLEIPFYRARVNHVSLLSVHGTPAPVLSFPRLWSKESKKEISALDSLDVKLLISNLHTKSWYRAACSWLARSDRIEVFNIACLAGFTTYQNFSPFLLLWHLLLSLTDTFQVHFVPAIEVNTWSGLQDKGSPNSKRFHNILSHYSHLFCMQHNKMLCRVRQQSMQLHIYCILVVPVAFSGC